MTTISRLPPSLVNAPATQAAARPASTSFATKVQGPAPAEAPPAVTGADIMNAFREMMLQQGSALGQATLSIRANVSIDNA